jgi:hypothetical protein
MEYQKATVEKARCTHCGRDMAKESEEEGEEGDRLGKRELKRGQSPWRPHSKRLSERESLVLRTDGVEEPTK